MSKNRELFKNTIIIFIGRFCTQFISFFLLPIYTNYLTTSEYGYIDLVQTYITLFVPIIILRFDSAIFRFLIDQRQNEKNKSEIISNTIFVILLQILISAILFLIINYFFNISNFYLILLNGLVLCLSTVTLQISRGLGDNLGYSIASAICGISTVIFNMIFIVVYKMGANYIFVSAIIGNLLCILYLFFKNRIYLYINFKEINKLKIKEMMKYSLPMIPDSLSWWITNVSDRTIISILLNNAANGIYSISCKFSNILSSFLQIFNMTWQESATLHIDDDDRDMFFSDIMNKTIGYFSLLCCIIMSVMPIVFKFFIGIDYLEAYNYIPLLLLSNIFNSISGVLGGVYIAKKQTKQCAKTTFHGALINLFINLIFIKIIGLWAAVISTLVSYIYIFVYRYIDTKKFVRFSFDKKNIIFSICIYTVCWILYLNNSVYLSIICIIFLFIYSILFQNDIYKFIIRKVKKKDRNT